jgi:hypothetical protein
MRLLHQRDGTDPPAVQPSPVRPLPRGPAGTQGPHASDPRQRAVRQANPAPTGHTGLGILEMEPTASAGQ